VGLKEEADTQYTRGEERGENTTLGGEQGIDREKAFVKRGIDI
jgi:hypothetical protein